MLFSSGLGILLSLIFGCLLLGLIAELYYLLWWKKQSKSLHTNGSSTSSSKRNEVDYIKHAKQHSYFFCWNKPSSTHHHQTTSQHQIRGNPGSNHDPDLESGSSKDVLLKPYGGVGAEGESVESELMRLHNLSGPPRFLFTINEETREDLESEDGRYSRSRKGSRTRSLSDLILAAESPFLSPLGSPSLKAAAGFSKLNAADFVGCYSHHGINPLFESSTVLEAELNRLRGSPPSKFKFLRDAEEKLYRRLLEEAERIDMDHIKKVDDCGGGGKNCQVTSEEVERKDGSFIRIIVGKNIERLEVQNDDHSQKFDSHQQQLHAIHSSCSQVLPLASSPQAASSAPLETKR